MPVLGALTGTRLIKETNPKDPPLTTTTTRTTPTGVPPATGGALNGGAPIQNAGPVRTGIRQQEAPAGGATPAGGTTTQTGTTTTNPTTGTEQTLNNTTGQNPQTLDTINKYFEDLLAESQKDWDARLGQYQRKADIVGNRMGFSAGGGGMAQMAGNATAQAALDFGDRQRQTRLAWIDKLIEQKRIEDDRAFQVDQEATKLWAMVPDLLGEFPGATPDQIYNALKTNDWSMLDQYHDKGDGTGKGGQNDILPPDPEVNSPYIGGLVKDGYKIENGQLIYPQPYTVSLPGTNMTNPQTAQVKSIPIRADMTTIKKAFAELGIDDPPTWMIQELQMYSTLVNDHKVGVGEMKARLRNLGWDTWYMKNRGLDLGGPDSGEP